jgi:opacity protein-like surface antigen
MHFNTTKKYLFSLLSALFLLMPITHALAGETGFTMGLGGGLIGLSTPDDYAFTIKDSSIHDFTNEYKIGGLGYQALFGYNFNTYFGLLSKFVLPEKSEYSASRDTGTLQTNAKLTYKTWAFNLLAKGQLPFGSTGLSLIGQGGLAYLSQSIDYKNDDDSVLALNTKEFTKDLKPGSFSQNAIRPTFGIGLNYDFTPTFAINLMLERTQGSGDFKQDKDPIADINALTASFTYTFYDRERPSLITRTD